MGTLARSLGTSSMSLLGAGLSRIEMGLEDLGSTLSTEADRHNLDGHRLSQFQNKLGNASSRVRDTVHTTVRDVREKGLVESDAGAKLRTLGSNVGSTVGESVTMVGERLQNSTGGSGSGGGGGGIMQSSSRHSDDLESLRRKMHEEQQILEAENMTREAERACLDVCQRHLEEFLLHHPNGGATYEEWLRALHPENDYEGRLLEGFSELDHRFYVRESDHLKMWNDSVDREEAQLQEQELEETQQDKQDIQEDKEDKDDADASTKRRRRRKRVEPRYRLGGHETDSITVDLLDIGGGGGAGGADGSTAPAATSLDAPLDIFADTLNGQGARADTMDAVQEGPAPTVTADDGAGISAAAATTAVDLLDLTIDNGNDASANVASSSTNVEKGDNSNIGVGAGNDNGTGGNDLLDDMDLI